MILNYNFQSSAKLCIVVIEEKLSHGLVMTSANAQRQTSLGYFHIYNAFKFQVD